jgi:hypothetical protein
MSHWRRLALEEVPTCKQVIEEAENPNALWSALYDELTSLEPVDSITTNQIYSFAFRCFKNPKCKALCSSVWVFFHYVVGGYIVGVETVRDKLPTHLSATDFHYWAKALKDRFPPERYAEATQRFQAAKHKTKYRIPNVNIGFTPTTSQSASHHRSRKAKLSLIILKAAHRESGRLLSAFLP